TALRRGSTASAETRASGQVRTTTQSPAQGSRAGSCPAAVSSAPARLARVSPVAVSTVQTPRSARATRPGCWPSPGVANSAYAEAKAASHPRDARSYVIAENLCQPKWEVGTGRLWQLTVMTHLLSK